MSHFTVGVSTPTGKLQDVRNLLAKYDESKIRKIIRTKEEVIQLDREANREVKESKQYQTYLNLSKEEFLETYHELSYIYLQEVMEPTINQTDEEIYQENLKHHDKNDVMDDGSLVYYENPDAKWDDWSIGGRWNGFITKFNGQRVNNASIKDINFELQKQERQRFENIWSMVENGNDVNHVFPHTHFDILADFIKATFKTKEEYIEFAARMTTFAMVLPDGEWIQKGNMGWFGVSDSTPQSEYDYTVRAFEELEKYKALGYHLTIVDCHI